MTHTPVPESGPNDLLDRRLTSALEASSRFTIPHDFAARTAALAHTQVSSYAIPATTSSFSLLSIRFALGALILAMLLLPAVAGASSILSSGSEVLFALELAALITWLSLGRNPLR